MRGRIDTIHATENGAETIRGKVVRNPTLDSPPPLPAGSLGAIAHLLVPVKPWTLEPWWRPRARARDYLMMNYSPNIAYGPGDFDVPGTVAMFLAFPGWHLRRLHRWYRLRTAIHGDRFRVYEMFMEFVVCDNLPGKPMVVDAYLKGFPTPIYAGRRTVLRDRDQFAGPDEIHEDSLWPM